MQQLRILVRLGLLAGCLVATGLSAMAADSRKSPSEDYVREPMPPGFQVVNSELEGPVFANAAGRTLYNWPRQRIRAGTVGEDEEKPSCYDVRYRESAGYYSPYPGGNELPNVDHRPTCIEYWPPVLAAPDAKPVGNWTILERTDGSKQWAYKKYALYTSHLDEQPGDTNGGTSRRNKANTDQGAPRLVQTPAPAVPSQFAVMTKNRGRLLTSTYGFSIYSYDLDTPTKSNCVESCLADWEPMIAPDAAVRQGEWSLIERPGGLRQWTFRGKPLYRYRRDAWVASYEGSDSPLWQNVFVQHAPPFPQEFRLIDTNGGQVLADAKRNPIYVYDCVEDTLDSLRCDAPDSAQEYRLAICGAGSVERCLKTFPYVLADKNAKSESRAWSIRDIDPVSGRYVASGTPGALRIWAYRARPIYTFVGDRDGEIMIDGWGQDHASKNGFNVFWVRDAYGGYGEDPGLD